MSRDKFAVCRKLTYGGVVVIIKHQAHWFLYDSVHTLRRRTTADGNAIVPTDNNGK